MIRNKTALNIYALLIYGMIFLTVLIGPVIVGYERMRGRYLV